MIYPLYLASLVLSVILSSILSFIFWQRRSIRGAGQASWLMAAAAIFALGSVLQLLNANMPGQIVATNIQYIGISAIPLAWFVFSLRYTNRDSWLSKKVIIMLSIIPAATVILTWTNSLHEFVWYDRHLENSGPFVVIAKNYGFWFWIHTGYSYLLLLQGTLTLIRRLFRRPYLYIKQSFALVFAVLVPVVWNVFYVFNIVPMYRIDLTPSAFTISGLAMLWGLFRSRLFDIMPIAYENIMESSSHSIIIVDMQNRIIEMNRTAEMTLDYPISRAIGRNVKEVMTVISGAMKALEDNAGEPSEITMQAGKTQRCYLVYSSTLQDRNKKPIGRLISLVDNTEYRRMEEHRKELESRSQMLSRLSTVGEMAAGIAHEVNNPLATVIGYTDLLLKQDLPESVKDDLHIIDRGAKRAAGILERLLTFSGKQNAERDFVDINRIMETAIEFRKHFLRDKNIEVIEEFDRGLPGTIADSGQLLEVFLNLILNAESSIISAGNPGFIKIITGTAGNDIVISFEDSGTGVSRENLDKIFNPFFTTKKVSEGSGLGLSICHGIITSHGGDISVTNNSPHGATFVITLPVVKYGTREKQGK